MSGSKQEVLLGLVELSSVFKKTSVIALCERQPQRFCTDLCARDRKCLGMESLRKCNLRVKSLKNCN